MRGTYDKESITSISTTPLQKKIIWSYISVLFYVVLLVAMITIIFIEKAFPNENIQYLSTIIIVGFTILSLVLVFALKIILKLGLAPLESLVNLSFSTSGLNEIEVPQDSSKEFRILYEIYNESLRKTTQLRELSAIAQTTQMLAHDVRKPFSMLQGVLSMIARANSLQEVRSISDDSIPEIERGISAVNGMIQDVMEVGSNGELSLELVNPETIVENAIKDSLRYIENIEIDFDYDFQHPGKFHIDILKTSRVLANIIGNGAQAMNYKGKMWFKTTAGDRGMTKCTIGNSDSYIPPHKIEKLFDAFFTSGKKGGTGLGLAIAKKIVEGHGGKIWCTSSEEEGTEFHFTLPTSLSPRDYTGELPINSETIRERFINEKEIPITSKESQDASESILEKGIIAELSAKSRNISILLVDDEKLYTTVLRNQITCREDLADNISILEVSSGEEALISCTQQKFDVIILDIDMGKDQLNGFEAAHKMRKLGIDGTICIHSNRSGSEYYKRAMDSGADMFIGKTMPREHFLKMIYGILGDPHKLMNQELTQAENSGTPKKIVVVEDNKIFRKAWEKLSEDTEVITFACPESVLKLLENDFSALDDIQAIVIDNNFGDLSDMTGFDLARVLKNKGIRATKAIASGESLSHDDIKGVFDVIIPKNPVDGLKELQKHL